jgi:signal transduction histidine kinase/ActR/RegA family two-component response regulator
VTAGGGGNEDDEDTRLRSTALKNIQTILSARQRAEQELLRTKEALEDETRILELLNKTGAMLASKLELPELVQAVTDAGTQVSGARYGAFFYTVHRPGEESLLLYALTGAPREAFDRFGHPRATALFGPTFRGEGIIRSGNILEDPRYGSLSPHHGMPPGHLPVCSYLAVPVKQRSGEVIGGLFFGHPDRDVFTDRTERIIAGIAGQAAIAIDNARLYEEAKRAAEAERAARAEVERASLVKDEFLATLSHELRTPLNAVLGWSEMLLLRVAPDADIRRGLETIVRNARAQAQLIEDLLDMNRIVSGKIRLDVQSVDLAAVVEAALDAVRPSAEAKTIRVRKTLDPLAGPVFGDPHRLQQVVWNLLSNAVKFTPKSGTVDLLLRRVNSHVEIVVTDSGIGISAEFLPHVFERFRQADSSTTRRHGGLGLGLSIVRQLIELHGGSVRAESPGLQQGSTFVVSLPVRAIHEEEHRPHPAARTWPVRHAEIRLTGVRVLVVDDEPDARELLRGVLADADATVFTAASADEALELLRSSRPDVIVSDVGMPDRDGYQLLRAVRALPPAEGGRTPAIALTAFARSEDRTRAMLAGYQVHIAKPIEPHELIVTIGSLTGRTGNVS